ncbi:MAG TPA: hypothetical protein VF519_04965 [Mycobacteriales bacterium]
MTRRLVLAREHLAELTTDELAGVAAAQQVPLPTQVCTGYYPSINAPCPTTWCTTVLTTV